MSDTAYEAYLATLKPTIELSDGNDLYDLTITITAMRPGVTFNPDVYIPALEAFMAAVEAAVSS